MIDCMFKGVDKQTNYWVQGDVIRDPQSRLYIGQLDFTQSASGPVVINPFILHEIYPNTLSRNSEFKDMFDRYVFENDIFEMNQDLMTELWLPYPRCTIIVQDGCFFANCGDQLHYLYEFRDKKSHKLRGQVLRTVFEPEDAYKNHML